MTERFEDTDEYAQLSQLVARLVDQDLDERELAQLVDILRKSDSAKEYYLRYLHLHSGLAAKWGAVENVQPQTPSSLNSPTHAPIRSDENTDNSWFPTNFPIPLLLCLLAGMLIGVFGKGIFPNATTGAPSSAGHDASSASANTTSTYVEYATQGGIRAEDAAVVVRSTNVDNASFVSGRRLKPGVLNLKQGTLQLEFMSGAIVALEGPVNYSWSR